MTIVENSQSSGLVGRVKGILLSPNTEWSAIQAEPSTIKGIYTGYAMPLAAISPVCALIGGVVIGHSFLGVSYHTPLVAGIVGAVVSYVLGLAMIYVMALIIDGLAPTFLATRDKTQAFKVAAYSMTAAWICGVLALLPALAPLALLGGLYSIYLLYLGIPKLMLAPEDKALPYTAVAILCAIVLSLIIGAVMAGVGGVGAMTGLGALHAASRTTPDIGTVKLGGNEVDVAKLAAAAKAMSAQAQVAEAQAKGASAAAAVTANGTVKAIPGDVLKAMLPGAVVGYTRTEIQSASGGIAGLQGSNAEGAYAKGNDQLTLSVADMTAMGGVLGAFNVNSSKETATGYEKVFSVNGRMTSEEYDRSAKSGKYSVVVASRFVVEAHGANLSMDDLKAAVGSVDFDKLESLAKG